MRPVNGRIEKCVGIALAKEKFSTRKIAKNLNFRHSTVLRVIELKLETGDINRKSGSGLKRAATIEEDK